MELFINPLKKQAGEADFFNDFLRFTRNVKKEGQNTYKEQIPQVWVRGGGPLVISHKCQVNLLVNLGTKASYAHSS